MNPETNEFVFFYFQVSAQKLSFVLADKLEQKVIRSSGWIIHERHKVCMYKRVKELGRTNWKTENGSEFLLEHSSQEKEKMGQLILEMSPNGLWGKSWCCSDGWLVGEGSRQRCWLLGDDKLAFEEHCLVTLCILTWSGRKMVGAIVVVVGCETMKWLVLLLFSSLVGGAKKLTTVQHESQPASQQTQLILLHITIKQRPVHDPYQFTTH